MVLSIMSHLINSRVQIWDLYNGTQTELEVVTKLILSISMHFQAPRDCSGGEDNCPECKNNQVECKFNFTYKDVVYNGCTDTDSEERWCATKVNEAGEYISGFWGFCDSGCLDHCEYIRYFKK